MTRSYLSVMIRPSKRGKHPSHSMIKEAIDMFEAEGENISSEQKGENEYRYAGGFEKENIYSDAHYTPAGEGPVPPRYYTPPEPKKAESKALKASVASPEGTVQPPMYIC